MIDRNEGVTPLETIQFLSSSRYRFEILTVFLEEEASTRQAVRDAVGASRSTVRRTLTAFVERGLIEATERGYRLTGRGKVLGDALEDVVELAEYTGRYESLFKRLDVASHDLDPTWLDRATMTVATQTNPYAPAQRQTDTVAEATTFRGLLPAIEVEGARLVHERVTDGPLCAEIVVPSTMLDTLTADPFASLFREQLATGRFECAVCDTDLPFYLGIPGERDAEIGVADADGIPRALVQSTNSELRAWAERTFEQYRADARPLDESEF